MRWAGGLVVWLAGWLASVLLNIRAYKRTVLDWEWENEERDKLQRARSKQRRFALRHILMQKLTTVPPTQRPILRRRPLRPRRPKRLRPRRHVRQSPHAQGHHPLHRRRDPLLLLPRRHHERQLRQHAAAVAGHDESHVKDGGEDGRGVEGVGAVFFGGVGCFCVCVVVLRGSWGVEDESGHKEEEA